MPNDPAPTTGAAELAAFLSHLAADMPVVDFMVMAERILERRTVLSDLLRLLAAPAAPSGAGWQPIATAPRQGRTLILLLGPSGFPQVAYSNTWWTAGFSVENKPTHWMKLPEVPNDGD